MKINQIPGPRPYSKEPGHYEVLIDYTNPESWKKIMIDEGQSQTLYEEFIKKSKLLPKLFEEEYHNNQRLHDFVKLLGNSDFKMRAARDILVQLWRKQRLVGIGVLLEEFAFRELDIAPQSWYRDHIWHSAIVFLIGVYILENNKLFFDEAKKQGWDEQEFLNRWVITSTSHDLGYLAELKSSHEPPEKFLSAFNDIAKQHLISAEKEVAPLLEEQYIKPGLLKNELSKTTSDSKINVLLTELNLHNDKISSVEDLQNIYGKSFDFFDILDKACINTLLHNSTPISEYFKLCQTKQIDNREPYYDHGIAGALIVLRLAYTHSVLFKKLNKYLKNNDISKERPYDQIFQTILNWAGDSDKYIKPCTDAAIAIALHNIDPLRFGELSKDSIRPNAYRIVLFEHPLAFLLYLCDSLQDWDRPPFTYLGGKLPDWSQGWDFNFSFAKNTEGKQTLFLNSFTELGKKRTKKIWRNLETYLAKKDLKKIVSTDRIPDNVRSGDSKNKDEGTTAKILDDYVERKDYNNKFQDWLNKSTSQYIFNLHGEPGTGKSTLLNKWLEISKASEFLRVYFQFDGGTVSIETFADMLKDQLPLSSKGKKLYNEAIIRYKRLQTEMLESERLPVAQQQTISVELMADNVENKQIDLYDDSKEGPSSLPQMLNNVMAQGNMKPVRIQQTEKTIYESKDENRCKLEYRSQLASDIVGALVELNGKKLIIFLDTLEKLWFRYSSSNERTASGTLDNWLFFDLFPQLKYKIRDLRVIGAGWYRLDKQLSYQGAAEDICYYLKCNVFTDEEAKDFLATHHNIIKEDLQKEIMKFTDCHPELLRYCVKLEKEMDTSEFIEILQNPKFKWVENLRILFSRIRARISVDNPILGRAVQYAAIPRIFDRELISILVGRYLSDESWRAFVELPFIEIVKSPIGVWYKMRDLVFNQQREFLDDEFGPALNVLRGKIAQYLAEYFESNGGVLYGKNELQDFLKELSVDVLDNSIHSKNISGIDFLECYIGEAVADANTEWGESLIAIMERYSVSDAIKKHLEFLKNGINEIKYRRLSKNLPFFDYLIQSANVNKKSKASIARALSIIISRTNELEKAEHYIQKAFENEDSPKNILQKAKILLYKKSIHEAKEHLIELVNHPKVENEKFNEGINLLFLMAEWDEIIKAIKNYISNHEEYAAEGVRAIGRIFINNKGDFEDAKGIIREQITRYPDKYEFKGELCQVLYENNEYDELLRYGNNLIENEEKLIGKVFSLLNNTFVYYKKEITKAEELIKNFKQKYPDNISLHIAEVNFLSNIGKYNKQPALVEKNADLDSENRSMHITYLASLYRNYLDDPDKALLVIDKGLEESSENTQLLNEKGLTLQRLKKWKAALGIWSKLLELDKGNHSYYLDRITTLSVEMLNEPEYVIETFENSISNLTDNEQKISIGVKYAHFLGNIGRDSEQSGLIQRMIAECPEESAVFDRPDFSQKNLRDKINELERVRSQRGNFSWVMKELGDLYLSIGDIPKALDIYFLMITRFPNIDNSESFNALEIIIRDFSDNSKRIIDFLKGYILIYPNNRSCRVCLVNCYVYSCDVENAIDCIKSNPSKSSEDFAREIEISFYVYHMAGNNLKKAKEVLDNAIELQPENILLLNTSVSIYQVAFREYQKAIDISKKCIELNPENTLNYGKSVVASYLVLNEKENAMEYLRKLRNKYGKEWNFKVYEVEVFESLENWDSALEAHENLANEDPTQFATSITKQSKILYEKMDRKQEAIKKSQDALIILPNNTSLLNNLFDIYLATKEYTNATEVLNKTSPVYIADKFQLEYKKSLLTYCNHASPKNNGQYIISMQNMISKHKSLNTLSSHLLLMYSMVRDDKECDRAFDIYDSNKSRFSSNIDFLEAGVRSAISAEQPDVAQKIIDKIQRLSNMAYSTSASIEYMSYLVWTKLLVGKIEEAKEHYEQNITENDEKNSSRAVLIRSLYMFILKEDGWQQYINKVKNRIVLPELIWKIKNDLEIYLKINDSPLSFDEYIQYLNKI